eukprot:COSAG01_NODE_15388_length_1344_cov_1.097992_2_plen_383_part_01
MLVLVRPYGCTPVRARSKDTAGARPTTRIARTARAAMAATAGVVDPSATGAMRLGWAGTSQPRSPPSRIARPSPSADAVAVPGAAGTGHHTHRSMIATLSLVVAASTASAGETPPPLGATVNADVLVYGATAAGCVAAIAASRSGARNVAVATPYGFIGGMTTGGIMHVDGANSTVIQGITREYFERVVSHYPQHPPLPPRPAAYSFACRAGPCIEQSDAPIRSTGDTCSNLCAPLAANEWLANTLISTLSADNRTLTVSLPVGQTHSFIKKSEKSIKYLNTSVGAGMVRKVQDGQVLSLGRPAVTADQKYLLIELASTTAAADAAAGMGHPSLPPLPPAPRPHAIGCPPLRDCWMYGSGVAERVLEEMLDEANVTVVRKLIG